MNTDIKPIAFTCADCKATIDLSHTHVDGYCGGSGYAVRHHDDAWLCYPCAEASDLQNMRVTGQGHLYLCSHTATDVGAFGQRFTAQSWAGGLKFDVYGLRHSWHNFAGANGRRDFYFNLDGYRWHGVNIGDQSFARVRRTKRKVGAK